MVYDTIDNPLILRGRRFSESDLEVIARCVKRHYDAGRTAISCVVCEELDWRQPNGWLKDRACRDVLRQLESRGVIDLPPLKIQPSAEAEPVRKPNLISEFEEATLITRIVEPITLELAKGNTNEQKWNQMVGRFHYLGHSVTVGKCLKFLVKSGDIILGGASLSESAWAVRDRDQALEYLGLGREHVANNSRFLVLPHVNVRNLASQVLALLVRHGVAEWERYYSVKLQCIETFVDSTRFRGTSYKAANWIRVGETSGYRKVGASHRNGQTCKHVYIYPLDNRMRSKLAAHIGDSKASL